MSEETIQTDVDRLIDILRINKKMELGAIAKELKIPEETIQTWADFLVEEKIVAIDYDFTKPILSLIDSPNKQNDTVQQEFLEYKKKFKQSKSTKKNNEDFIWKQHILKNLELMKSYFFVQAKQRNFENIEELWLEYKEKVTKT